MASERYYSISRCRSRLGLQKADEEERFHNIIFIERNPDQSGDKIHITGSVADGFRYEVVPNFHRPETHSDFVSRDPLGHVRASDYSALETILKSLPVPTHPQQRWFGGGAGGWKRCKQDGSWFHDGETVTPLVRCTEWTENYAVPALRNSGLVHIGTATQQTDRSQNDTTSQEDNQPQ